MRFVLVPAVLALGLSATGCGSPETPGEGAVAPLTLERRSLSARGGECPDPETRCATVDASWIEAVAGPEDARLAVNAYVVDRLRSGLRGLLPQSPPLDGAGVPELADAFVESYEEFLREYPDAQAAWFHRFQAEAPLSSHRVVTILTVEQSYTGGAHGLERVAYASFRSDTGERITIDDLVADRSALVRAGERRFREARHAPEGESLEAAGFTFEGGTFALPDNFGVFPEGIRFRWDAYEIASYADGPTEITIEWDDVAGALKTDGPRP